MAPNTCTQTAQVPFEGPKTVDMSVGCPHCCNEVTISVTVHHPKVKIGSVQAAHSCEERVEEAVEINDDINNEVEFGKIENVVSNSEIETNENDNEIETNENDNEIETNENDNEIKTNENVNEIETNINDNEITNSEVNIAETENEISNSEIEITKPSIESSEISEIENIIAKEIKDESSKIESEISKEENKSLKVENVISKKETKISTNGNEKNQLMSNRGSSSSQNEASSYLLSKKARKSPRRSVAPIEPIKPRLNVKAIDKRQSVGQIETSEPRLNAKAIEDICKVVRAEKGEPELLHEVIIDDDLSLMASSIDEVCKDIRSSLELTGAMNMDAKIKDEPIDMGYFQDYCNPELGITFEGDKGYDDFQYGQQIKKEPMDYGQYGQPQAGYLPKVGRPGRNRASAAATLSSSGFGSMEYIDLESNLDIFVPVENKRTNSSGMTSYQPADTTSTTEEVTIEGNESEQGIYGSEQGFGGYGGRMRGGFKLHARRGRPQVFKSSMGEQTVRRGPFNVPLLTCQHCPKTFTSVPKLRDHTRVHTGERPYSCELCNKTFKQKAHLTSHMNGVHLDERNFKCPQCPMKFKQMVHLTGHVKHVHIGERNYKCPHCSSAFKMKAHLVGHVRNVHIGDRNHECPHCHSMFKQLIHLQGHIKTVHFGKRDHICPHCPKAFKQRAHLTNHIKGVHIGARNFSCPHCMAGFKQKAHLTGHVKKVHLGEKTHICPYCPQAFTARRYLNNHMDLSHTEKQLEKALANENYSKVLNTTEGDA